MSAPVALLIVAVLLSLVTLVVAALGIVRTGRRAGKSAMAFARESGPIVDEISAGAQDASERAAALQETVDALTQARRAPRR